VEDVPSFPRLSQGKSEHHLIPDETTIEKIMKGNFSIKKGC
jgi:hypothetical protein